ncbi:MAG: ABC transporter permease [Desulfobacterales bacterium]|jgi:putative ABC transport system permease protein|nr:ABC transporter permease [Desulfobacterales bacterium]
MIDSLYLAWQYLRFNKARTLILVSCITIIAALPMALEILLNESEQQLALRADSSPLLVGAKGSALDLVMNSIYFGNEVPEAITMAAVEQVSDTGLAAPIPLYVRFKARGFPIVGTTLDYFDFRGLQLQQGEMFVMLGQCVIGAEVAMKLNLKAGDYIVSSPETLFDIAGIYPLKMKIAGVLAPNHSADDLGVFVDIRTAWVIQGLGHGHKDVTKTTDSSVILKKDKGNVTANAKLMQYTEITAENIDSFHLHGDPTGFPVTAVLAIPDDDKAGTILQGRYLGKEILHQIVRPKEVIDTLMANIFKIRNVLDAVIMLVGTATLLALILVFSLSLRLREREIDIIFKLGCSRATIAKLLGAEICIITAISLAICGVLVSLILHYDQMLVRNLFI